jgi:2-dehydrotetronate isomerase
MPKLSANLSFLFPELPFLDRFAAAKAAGFSAVEFAFAYEHPADQVAAAAKAAAVEVVLMNLPPGDWDAGERGLSALAGRETDFHAALDRAILYAEAAGCRRLHAMAGVGPTAQEEIFVKNLAGAAARLAGRGIALLIEPINVIDMPGYFLTLPEQARRIIERINHPNLFLQLDLYHCQIMRGDLARQIEGHLPVIGHIQIAGNPGRHEPDVGEINYPYLFDLMNNLGYRGWVGCEYRPAGDTVGGLGWARPYLGPREPRRN